MIVLRICIIITREMELCCYIIECHASSDANMHMEPEHSTIDSRDSA